jgi:cyclase
MSNNENAHAAAAGRLLRAVTALLACAGFASLALGQAQQSPPDFSKVQIKPVKIADNFYVIDESEVHGGSISVFTGPDGVLLVDTGVAPLAAKVEAAIKRLSPQPIRYVINTHAHVDEVAGNEHFAKLGATIVAREQVRYTMLHPRKPLGNVQGREARQIRQTPPEAVPKLTFSDAMALHFNGQDIRVIAVPRAHTDGDALILFPGLDIIVAGDVLRAYEYPSVNRPDGGTLQGMLDGLANLIGRTGPATKIVTSHGEVVDRSVAIAQRDLLLTTRTRITALLAQGKTAEEIVAAKITADQGVRVVPGHISGDAFVRDIHAELEAGR